MFSTQNYKIKESDAGVFLIDHDNYFVLNMIFRTFCVTAKTKIHITNIFLHSKEKKI